MARPITYTDEQLKSNLSNIHKKHGAITLENIAKENGPSYFQFGRLGTMKSLNEMFSKEVKSVTATETVSVQQKMLEVFKFLKKKIAHTKASAQSNGTLFHKRHITPEFLMELYIKQNGKCTYYMGQEMSVEKNSDFIMSIDQIIPSKGYSRDNVQLVTWAANRAKGGMTDETFRELLAKTALCLTNKLG